MSKLRDEVSARRCELIRKQHTHIVLKEVEFNIFINISKLK